MSAGKRIGLNLMYVAPGLAGGRVYAEGLLQGLAAVDHDHRYLVFTRRGVPLPPLPADRFEHVVAPVAPRSVLWRTYWEYRVLPRRLAPLGIDLFHGLGTLSPPSRIGPFVLTVHDLIYRRYPQSIPHGFRQFMRWVNPGVARRADRIIVPSEATRRDAVALLGVPDDRIRVVAYGPGNDFRPTTDDTFVAKTLGRLGVRAPFVVSVGRGYAHKNLAGLLRAFAVLRKSRADARLVLVGEGYRTGSELASLSAQLELDDAVVFTGFVSNEELQAVYTAANVFAFPSLAEGFGLPLLEAMACGVPVVASDASAVPEAVGDAGVLADARNPGAFAAALARVLADDALRSKLREAGLRRAAEFSWEKAARETVAVYRELL